MFSVIVFPLKKVGEKQQLVVDRPMPIGVIMLTGAREELMRNMTIEHFFVQTDIYRVKEIFRAAVE